MKNLQLYRLSLYLLESKCFQGTQCKTMLHLNRCSCIQACICRCLSLPQIQSWRDTACIVFIDKFGIIFQFQFVF